MQDLSAIVVKKVNGEKEPFSEEKLIHSIHRAGISEQLQHDALIHVEQKLYNEIPTTEIYEHLIEFLDKNIPYAKGKYGLKQAIMELGPTGYPFEDFIAALLRSKGYQVELRQILQGKCVTHEIDVLAKKDGKTIAIECKFHNTPGIRSDIHVALYTKARFDDIKELNKLDQMWLITNTKATTDAIKYGMCSGVEVISWNYPQNNSLRDWVNQVNLHPITEITSLTQQQKQQLFNQHIVLCKDLADKPYYLNSFNLSENQRQAVLDEINFINAS